MDNPVSPYRVISKVNPIGGEILVLIPKEIYEKLGRRDGIFQVHQMVFGVNPCWSQLFDDHFTVQLAQDGEFIKQFDDALAEALSKSANNPQV